MTLPWGSNRFENAAAHVVGGAAPWLPSDEASLLLWYKADAKTYNTGTTLATNGQTIATWGDNASHAWDLTQATSANRPTWSSTGLGGVVFNNTTKQWLFNAFGNIDWGSSSPQFTVLVAFKPTATHNQGLIGIEDNGGASGANTTSIKISEDFSTGAYGPFWNSNNWTTDLAVGSGTTTRLGLTFDGTSLTSYKNNVAATPHTAAVALQQSLFAFCVGNPFYNDIQVMYDGTIYEVIVFKSALGGTSRSGAETYLQRWV